MKCLLEYLYYFTFIFLVCFYLHSVVFMTEVVLEIV